MAVAVSGGADSVALLLALAQARAAQGLVLSAVHVHHGLRGAEADGDEQFVRDLTARLDVPLRVERGDVAALAAERGQGIEEAARALRYRVFGDLLGAREVDAVATAHTLDDQAETVLMKLLRGAWTEGLGGIAPVVECAGGGRIVRPLLQVTRDQVLAFLRAAKQPWREDSTNAERVYTRNRVRHDLLPALRAFNPQVSVQLAQMAALARDEEAWWTKELARVLPGLVLPGRPVRGGGRSHSTEPGRAMRAMELERLRTLHPALARRVLRAVAEELGTRLDFAQTEDLLALAQGSAGRPGTRAVLELGPRLVAERTPRELQMAQRAEPAAAPAPEEVPVPGVWTSVRYGLEVTAAGALPGVEPLRLRLPAPGDRVRLAHSSGPKTLKEVLERVGMDARQRARQPILAIGQMVVWVGDMVVEGVPGLEIQVRPHPVP